MNGGYLMVSKSDTNLYAKLNNALTVGKPILWYEDANTCYYIDTITKSGTDIVLTKGGKTITIESDGDITEVGDVLTIMENIVDANGNKRFIEGEGQTTAITGVTYTYNKWSLSGTHLMIVLAGSVADTTVIPNGYILDISDIPSYIKDKIKTVAAGRVLWTTVQFTSESLTTQTTNMILEKSGEYLRIYTATLTLNANRSFRVQFDLLIDAE